MGISTVLIKLPFYSLFSLLCAVDKVLPWRQRGDFDANLLVAHWVTNGPKSPKKQCNHLMVVELFIVNSEIRATAVALNCTGRFLAWLWIFTTSAKWSDLQDLDSPSPNFCIMAGTRHNGHVQHRGSDENCLRAALLEWTTEERICSVCTSVAGTQTPTRVQCTKILTLIYTHAQSLVHTQLNRWSDRSGLLCMNAPQISLCCISQPTVFLLN